MSFHKGELAIQEQNGVQLMASRIGRGIRDFMPDGAMEFVETQPIAVVASVDDRNRVWASLLYNEAGFISPLDEIHLLIKTSNLPDDVFFENVKHNPHCGMIIIDFATRMRMRVNGRIASHAGGFVLQVDQAYANCQKYIHANNVLPPVRNVSSVEHSQNLTDAQSSLISHADTLFIASHYHESGADASHRGGEPGFVRAIDDRRLEFPDYSGNMMFNTLGNLAVNENAGLLFIDFATGSTLQLTGKAKIIRDEKRVAAYAGAQRVIEYHIESIIQTTALPG